MAQDAITFTCEWLRMCLSFLDIVNKSNVIADCFRHSVENRSTQFTIMLHELSCNHLLLANIQLRVLTSVA